MFERCLNPDCGLPFDYREGRLIRFCPTEAQSPAEGHGVEHFWLCGKCSERYVFAHERGVAMRIRLRGTESQEIAARSFPLPRTIQLDLTSPGDLGFARTHNPYRQ